ncbi:potassium transporter [Candidatus Woesearchaeota archaeon CG10_big_fil_rev_8_21_14_0_10_45_16]|nr:MAG: potassium transporter [Candidatus Woesearchaeota archaeon CG10_big_fil_rev_8_21_14_0_10_45_16]
MLARRITYSLVLTIILLSFGTIYFHHLEDWSYVDAFYFSSMTLTTVGYGDLVPTHTSTKIITPFYAVFGIAIMLYLIGTVIGHYVQRQEKYFEHIVSVLEEPWNKRKKK